MIKKKQRPCPQGTNSGRKLQIYTDNYNTMWLSVMVEISPTAYYGIRKKGLLKQKGKIKEGLRRSETS